MNALLYPPGLYYSGRQISDSVVGTQIIKGPLSLPQNATANLFTVTGGSVMVIALVGQVTTTIGATANQLAVGLAPLSGSPNTSGFGDSLAINGVVAGTIINMPFSVGVAGSNLVAPVIPSSGQPVTNNYHGTVDVTVSGGTLSNVVVNGVSVGTGDGTYRVPAHGQITLTYSVAPTWTWASSSALVSNSNGVLNVPRPHIIPAGTITWTTTASSTGAIKWYLDFIQLDSQPGFHFGVVNL